MNLATAKKKRRRRKLSPERAAIRKRKLRTARQKRWRLKKAGRTRRLPFMGVVYFVQCQDFVKIGWSSSFKKRRIALNTLVPFDTVLIGTIAGSLRRERELHERFASHRVRGEWFHLTDEIRELALSEPQN